MTGRMTLEELYVLVPSTEDYDLAEEAEVERLHARLVKEYVALLGPVPDDPLPGAPAPPPAAADPAPAEPEWRPTDAQALGCLEHLLGAQVVSTDEEEAATPPDAARDPGPPELPDRRGDAEDPAG